MNHLPVGRTRLLCGCLASQIVMAAVTAGLPDGDVADSAIRDMLTVPARFVVRVPPPPADSRPTIIRNPPPQVTPAARMPQYQLQHRDEAAPADPDSDRLRMALNIPGRPLLIEARILIDGQPFRQIREQRVEDLARYVTDPESYRAAEAADRAAAEAQQRAGATLTAARFLYQLLNGTTASRETVDPPDGISEPAEDRMSAESAAPEPIHDRLDRYMAATGMTPSADEIRWLLATWIDGPVLLLLNDNFQHFRADQQPVFDILDRDGDRTISSDELQQAVQSLQECDVNRDGIVETTEISDAARDPRREPGLPPASRLLTCVDDDAPAETVRRQLPDFVPDLRIHIDLKTTVPEQTRLTLEEIPPEFSDESVSGRPVSDGLVSDGLKRIVRNPASLTLEFPDYFLELLVTQRPTAVITDQISVGAINDGYAMLPELDPNNDGRLTIRELRQLQERLKPWDRNADGRVEFSEVRPTYRLCFGLGATAHEPLALLRELTEPSTAGRSSGPLWFQQMDQNQDDDLTRDEFPGTDEQFQLLDADSDQLISAGEAADVDGF